MKKKITNININKKKTKKGMAFNMDRLSTLEKTLLEVEQKNFKFLEDTFLKRKIITDYALKNTHKVGANVEDIKGKHNFILVNDDVHYLKLEHFKKIYDMLLNINREELKHFRAVKLKDEKIKQKHLNKIHNYKLKDNTLHNIINNILENIINKNLEKDEKQIKILTKNKITLTKAIESCISNSIINKMHRNKFELEHVELMYTNLASQIGDVIFQSYITTNKKLEDFILNPENELEFMKKFLVELDEGNTFVIKHTLMNNFKIEKDDLTSHIIINNIGNFIFEKLLKDIYQKNMLINDDSIQINSIINNRKEKLIKIQKELTTLKIKLGARIIEELIIQEVFSKKIKYMEKTKKPTYFLEIENELTFKILLTQSTYKPYLVSPDKNAEPPAISIKKSKGINIEGVRYKSFIHTNRNVEAYSEITLKDLKFSTPFTIDITFLEMFLGVLAKTINQKYTDESLDPMVFTFLTIYGFDFERLYEVSKAHGEEAVILKLINFSVDFDIDIDKDLKNYIIKNIEQHPNRRNFYLSCYNKILNYKAYLKGLLQEAILYSLFGFFFVPGFSDARGRYYLEGYYLNVQNFPICKAFVKFFNYSSGLDKEQNFKDLKNEFQTILKSKDLSEKVRHMPFDDYKKTYSDTVVGYILSCLKVNTDNKETLEENIKEYLNDSDTSFEPQKLLHFLKLNIKDQSEFFILFSYIITEHMIIANRNYKLDRRDNKNNTYCFLYGHYTNIQGFDATTSGLQMTAILFRSQNLAEISNLTGNSNNQASKNDIYGLFADAFKAGLKNASSIMVEYLKLEPQMITDLFNVVLTDDDSDVIGFCTTFCKNFRAHFPENLDSTMNTFRQFKWFLTPKHSSICEKTKIYTKYVPTALDDNFIEIIFIMHAIIFLVNKELQQDNGWKNDCINRSAFKHAVLTFGYSSTPYGRREGFIKYLLEAAHEIYMNWEITRKDVFEFATILEQFFDYSKDALLEDCTKLLTISENLAKNAKPIQIITPYFNLTFSPYKTKKAIVNTSDVLTGKRKHQLTIRLDTNQIDRSKFSSTFGPNFVHAMDATIVHLFRSRVSALNKLLEKHDISVNQFTNHDTFCFTAYPLLKILVQDCYLELYHMDFLSLLLKNKDNHIPKDIRDVILKSGYKQGDSNFFNGTFDNNNFIGF